MVHFNGVAKGEANVENKYLRNQLELEQKIKDFNQKFNQTLTEKLVLEEALKEALKEDDENAINDAGSTNQCIGLDGLRRLNKRFGHSTPSVETN